MPVPDSQIGLTMAVPIDVATGPRDPESEPVLVAPGLAIEERPPVQTGGQRARASVGDTPSHRTQLQPAFTASWARSVSRYNLVSRYSSVEDAHP